MTTPTELPTGVSSPSPGKTYQDTSGTGDEPSFAGIDSQYMVNVGGDSPPPMKTLVYTPDVRIIIARDNKEYDVSADIVACSVQRVENSVSTAMFKLTNKDHRYTPLFAPMDRVAIFMKRVEWFQVFSGYLDKAPLLQLYQGTVDFQASCTIKLLLHTWWDPGLEASRDVFDQAGNNLREAGGQETQPDKGLGSTLRRMLISVGNWDSKNIHIQQFPFGYYDFMKSQIQKYSGTEDAVREFRRMLLGDDVSGGVGAQAGEQTGINMGLQSTDIVTRKMEVIRAVDEMGMGPDNTGIGLGQAVNTAAGKATDKDDQGAWKPLQELGRNYDETAQKSDAAVHCFMTVAVESSWIMWANSGDPESLKQPHEAVGNDHDSVGLFQQRPSWGSVQQRMNPRASAQLFLRELNTKNWRNMPRGEACQAVQRSAFPGKYALQESVAMEEVRAIRTGTQGTPGTGGQSGGIPSIGTPPPAILGGSLGGAGIPTTNGLPSVSAANTAIGRPQFDTQTVVNFGMTLLGTPYEYGANGPLSYDCSSFTKACYAKIGIDIGRDTYTQHAKGTKIPVSQAKPGDLLFPADLGHVVINLGGGMILHAPQTGDVVKVASLYFTPASAVTFPPAEWGGPGPTVFDPSRVSPPGAAPGTRAQGTNGGTVVQGSTEPIARNLFSYTFEPGRYSNTISGLFGGGDYGGSPSEAAFINDEPLIQSVRAVATAGLRNFQSMPNGDFAAYYPDYFGLDGKDAVMDLEDIEMKDVSLNINDEALATHVYVAGSMDPRGGGSGTMGWLNTKGIATVENPWMFARMRSAAPQIPGAEMLSGTQIMRRYGVRPLTQQMSMLQNGAMEFLMALQIFMTKWAEQYSTQIEITFMPELYPGMRINLVGHNLQVYVSNVTHSGDFENGFATTATIMAPSTPFIRQIASRINQSLKFGTDPDVDASGQTRQWMYPGSGG